jgi:mono/diheme cytochrome c family protein
VPPIVTLAATALLSAAPTALAEQAREGAPAPPAAQAALDFQFYRAHVEPIFIKPRRGYGPGLSPCATCHVHNGSPLKLQPLQEGEGGRVFWSEEQSRRNFEVASRLVVPGRPEQSRLLRKPLAVAAGGAPFHVGGKFWSTQDDPEWRTIAEWVRAASAADVAAGAAAAMPTLDFDFFRTCVQRIFLNKRPGLVQCVHCHNVEPRNFAAEIPEGRNFWNLEESRQNFAVLQRYIEPGFPLMSRFLTHPLAPEAGGDHFHAGGRRWPSQDDPEWRMLAAWVRGEATTCLSY